MFIRVADCSFTLACLAEFINASSKRNFERLRGILIRNLPAQAVRWRKRVQNKSENAIEKLCNNTYSETTNVRIDWAIGRLTMQFWDRFRDLRTVWNNPTSRGIISNLFWDRLSIVMLVWANVVAGHATNLLLLRFSVRMVVSWPNACGSALKRLWLRSKSCTLRMSKTNFGTRA